jgi:hypothetical protein
VVAARPWAAAAGQDPRLARLAAREQRLRAEAATVKQIVDRRWAAYQARLAKRRQLVAVPRAQAPAAPAPAVRIVTLPPVTSTSSS